MSSNSPEPRQDAEPKKRVVPSAQQLEPAPAPERSVDIYDFMAWFEVNKKRVGIVIALGLVAGFAIYTWNYLREQKEVEASTALLALRPTVVSPTNTTPVPASAFAKVADQYQGTAAAERAQLLNASALFTEGKYAESQAQFSKFSADHPQSDWVGEAQYGVAACLEAQNKTNEALAAYQNVATSYASSSVAGDAKMSLARMYESQKQPEQALRLYNELIPTDTSFSNGRSEAYAKREALYKDYPWLNTNKPIATPKIIKSGAIDPSKIKIQSPPGTKVQITPVPNPAPATKPKP